MNDERAKSGHRVVDWGRALLLTIEAVVAAIALPLFVSAALVGTTNRAFWLVWFTLLIPMIGLALWVAKTQFSGISFKPLENVLSYPSYFFSRTILLNEIRDANAQQIKGGAGSLLWELALMAAQNRTMKARQHAVNLSGEFGSCQIRFLTRQRRDQFLSALSTYAPDVSITRGMTYS